MACGFSRAVITAVSLQRLPDQPPIPRRQGTVNLKLSEWKVPKHYGASGPSSTASNSAPSPHKHHRKNSDANEVKQSIHPQPVAKKSVSKLPAAAPIPLTTNAAPSRSSRPVNPPAQPTSAPDVDVTALLAEWHNTGPEPAPAPATSCPANRTKPSVDPDPGLQTSAATARSAPVRRPRPSDAE